MHHEHAIELSHPENTQKFRRRTDEVDVCRLPIPLSSFGPGHEHTEPARTEELHSLEVDDHSARGLRHDPQEFFSQTKGRGHVECSRKKKHGDVVVAQNVETERHPGSGLVAQATVPVARIKR